MSGNTLFWAGALLIGAVLLLPDGSREAAGPAPEAGGKPPAPAPVAARGFASHELRRGPDGHFYAEADVNGARIRFLVDTGASLVALTAEDARRAGIRPGDARASAMGAGGEIEIAPVTIDRIAVGPIETRGVRGAVVEKLPVSLLGQSFLQEADGVEIAGDRMVLR
ncbi:TIGR02281 family clan AA aspartic protease [Sphingosinicella sp. LHD-64]|uniref:retropepsin-like aspartic protease family protein n=1 Tax=Sphingosinicella sp. LHD-64 TaxID=3072139 RepID=UPI00280DE401|nr:TIGR02281 family clan AA aspartic protease [Sphingosinicella sp. LHD-64]MDQ8755910.1 TIGR02281 family clan AA aspartic protease [Sphingosinicella sp. LHD-64]